MSQTVLWRKVSEKNLPDDNALNPDFKGSKPLDNYAKGDFGNLQPIPEEFKSRAMVTQNEQKRARRVSLRSL